MVIHTIGDSHSNNGWSTDIINHYFPDMFCYDLGIYRINKVDIRNFNINDCDSIIFCFGELDCRFYKRQTLVHFNFLEQ